MSVWKGKKMMPGGVQGTEITGLSSVFMKERSPHTTQTYDARTHISTLTCTYIYTCTDTQALFSCLSRKTRITFKYINKNGDTR